MAHAPGWYPDGSETNILRWWDGNQWTEHTAPGPDSAQPTAAQPAVAEPAVAQPAVAPAAQPTTPIAPPQMSGESQGAGAATAMPAPGTAPTPEPDKKPVWKQWWAIAAAAVAAIAVIGAFVVGSGGDDDADSEVVQSAPQEDGEADANVDTDTDTDTDDAQPDSGADGETNADSAPDDESDAVEGTDDESGPDAGDDGGTEIDDGQADAGEADGSIDRPFVFDAVVPVQWDSFGDGDGAVWNTSVSTPRDITIDVAAFDEFNEPPPEGVAFLGFDVSMTLIESQNEPLNTGFTVTWEVLGGSTASVYDETTIDTENFGCGLTPEQFDPFVEVFAGGTVAGTVCIPVPVEDVDDPGTQISMTLVGSDRIVYSSAGTEGPSALDVPQPAVTPADGDGPADGSRSTPFPFDTPTDVEFNSFGDTDGSVWSTTVGIPRDIGAEVAAESQFNEPPPDGVTFLGFEVTMTLVSGDVEPLSPGFSFDWQVLGGNTATAYGPVTLVFGCRLVPNEFDDFAEVLVGGTLTGTVCVPVPTADLDDAGTSVAMNFIGESRIVFHN